MERRARRRPAGLHARAADGRRDDGTEHSRAVHHECGRRHLNAVRGCGSTFPRQRTRSRAATRLVSSIRGPHRLGCRAPAPRWRMLMPLLAAPPLDVADRRAGRRDPGALDPEATVVTIGTNYFETARSLVVCEGVCLSRCGSPGRGAAIVNERFVESHFPAPTRSASASNFPTTRQAVPTAARNGSRLSASYRTSGSAPPQDGGFDPVVYVPSHA